MSGWSILRPISLTYLSAENYLWWTGVRDGPQIVDSGPTNRGA
jgi:hypothetical protein